MGGGNNPLHSITLQKLIQTNILEPVKIFGNGFFLHNLILTLLSEKKKCKRMKKVLLPNTKNKKLAKMFPTEKSFTFFL